MNISRLDLDSCIADARVAIENVDGWLSDREMAFLVTLAANPTCDGEVLELGSYHGKSTIALAKGAALAGSKTIHSVDPLPAGPLAANLTKAAVRDRVAFYNEYSTDRSRRWNMPLRLLWHDGANDLATVSDDVEQLVPWLVDGAIVAFHDVLNTSGDRIFVYVESVLANPLFGVAGVCGSIGWAQYRTNVADAQPFHLAKHRLARKLKRLEPYHDPTQRRGVKKLRYKLLRAMVPHGRVDPEQWKQQVA